jgi:hypothetical protein
MDENTNIENNEPEAREGKQSTRTFSQSEVDQMVAKAANGVKSQYADYDEIKTNYEAILQSNKEKELADKSELEKAQAINSDLIAENTNVKTELTKLKRQQLRNEVLNGAEFQSMPRAYKNMVSLSDDLEEVQKSAQDVLDEFRKDTGIETAKTFGVPLQKDTVISEPAQKVDNPNDLANSLRSKLSSIIQRRNGAA